VKGFNRNYSYDAAGYVTSDGKRTYTWTSFGQLKQLVYESAPELRDLTGFIRYAAGRVQSEFDFDAAGGRARQVKERIAPNDAREIETTLYLGAYERENHTTKTNELASPVLVKTVHRHSLGGGMIYTRTLGGSEPGTKLTNVLKDHLGSTDALVVGIWNGSTFANQSIERLSFDAWGERRDATTQISYRATDTDPFRTSAKDHDRGYTGHEQLDDSGLIHMNGRIYDPELGRFLSPDPIVQIPEYSQNFNRYSYVLNNPLNATDPSGFSFISKAFSKIGSFIKENWRTIVAVALGFAVGLVAGALAKAWAVGMHFTAAMSAAIGAGVGAFWGNLTSSLIMGQELGDSLMGSLKAGVTAALLTFTITKGLEFAVKHTNPLDKAKLYEVDASSGKWKEVDWNKIKDPSLKGKTFINGMNNEFADALKNGVQRVNGQGKFYLIENPTNGALSDLLECGLDKFGGQSNISKSTADILSKFIPQETTILAHSQGTLIATNSLHILSSRQSIDGFTFQAWGSAQNKISAMFSLGSRGVNVGNFANHPADAVANIIGFNAITIPSPYRIGASLISSPLLLSSNPELSSHGKPDGGSLYKWLPWLYQRHK
jgi:RHS repeat-associated protein